jgi:hypothetical protein
VEVSAKGRAWTKGGEKIAAKTLMRLGLAAYESRLSIVSTPKGIEFARTGKPRPASEKGGER